MTKKYTYLLVCCMSAAFVTGCDSSASQSATPSSSQEDVQKPGSGQGACYPKNCAPVVGSADLVDPKGDYKYQDPSKFPQASQRPYYQKPKAFLDLKVLDPNTQLSANFLLKDFASAAKGRYALISTDMIERLQKIRDSLGAGLRINSGYRSPGYNRDVDGSAGWSRHTYGDGVDLAHSAKSLKQIRDACTKNSSTFFLLYKTHIHCDWRAIPLDPAFYTSSKTTPAQQQLMQNSLALSKDTQILFHQSHEGVRLSVKMPEVELEGEPVYEWHVYTPSGEELTFHESQPVIDSINMSGTYHVKVIVGDFIESEAQIDLE